MAAEMEMEMFLRSSTMDVFIPKATDFEIEELIDSSEDAMSSVEKRSLLYFGMQKKGSTKAPSSYSFLGMC